jgi:hypothetical protein
MKTFYDFIAEWKDNCDICVHCGHVQGDHDILDWEHGYVGCRVNDLSDKDVYTDEVIEAYFEEEVEG